MNGGQLPTNQLHDSNWGARDAYIRFRFGLLYTPVVANISLPIDWIRAKVCELP